MKEEVREIFPSTPQVGISSNPFCTPSIDISSLNNDFGATFKQWSSKEKKKKRSSSLSSLLNTEFTERDKNSESPNPKEVRIEPIVELSMSLDNEKDLSKGTYHALDDKDSTSNDDESNYGRFETVSKRKSFKPTVQADANTPNVRQVTNQNKKTGSLRRPRI
jgi:hypothetical protein